LFKVDSLQQRRVRKKGRAAARPFPSRSGQRSDGLFFHPIAQMENFPYFSAFVSMTELFLWLEFGFTEAVLWIPNDFTH
jgi:hypothetical protein